MQYQHLHHEAQGIINLKDGDIYQLRDELATALQRERYTSENLSLLENQALQERGAYANIISQCHEEQIALHAATAHRDQLHVEMNQSKQNLAQVYMIFESEAQKTMASWESAAASQECAGKLEQKTA